MKILFAGPSLYGCPADRPGIVTRPPAAHGDLQAAVLEGATAIGLVDGLYETIAAVWHKEILFALSQGVVVLGAASLGALRAAECAQFGMVPVGEIAARYLAGSREAGSPGDGALHDDAAVAQLHAPAELRFQPVTEALVDCEPGIASLVAAGLVGADAAARLLACAEGLFFKDRTWPAMFRGAGLSGPEATAALRHLKDRRTSLKRRDALLLVETLIALPDRRADAGPSVEVAPTQAFLRTLDAARARIEATAAQTGREGVAVR